MVCVDLIVGARPNIVKIAPLYHTLLRHQWCAPRIVHTGQHYDACLSDNLFRDFGLPDPEVQLGVGSGSHAEQTAQVMLRYERACLQSRPDWIVVVGDVNSTLACALVGAKLGIPVAHLEAGLRSGDRSMPEEINRIATDAISDLLWTHSADADENLRREGVAAERVDLVGNIMIDAYEHFADRISSSTVLDRLNLSPDGYGVVTLHRPSNVDDRERLELIVDQLRTLAGDFTLVFPVHPRTRSRLDAFSIGSRIEHCSGIITSDPLSYLDFMCVMRGARFVITDSGGVQEETSHLGIPCLTVRENTERPVTLLQGTNRLVTPGQLSAEARQAAMLSRRPCMIRYWDGRTAERVASSLAARVGVHTEDCVMSDVSG